MARVASGDELGPEGLFWFGLMYVALSGWFFWTHRFFGSLMHEIVGTRVPIPPRSAEGWSRFILIGAALFLVVGIVMVIAGLMKGP